MDFSNIPILKDIDFSDPAKRKNIILIATAGALIVILLIVLLIQNNSKKDTNDSLAQEEVYQSPDIPLGEDRDQLDGKQLRDVLESPGKSVSADDLFDDTQIDDPLNDLLEEKTNSRFEVPEIRTDVYPEARDDRHTQSREQEYPSYGGRPHNSDRSSGSGLSQKEIEQQERDAYIRRRMIQEGYDPDTGLPLASGLPSSSAGAQSSQVSQPVEETHESATPKMQVRRSGGVSTLGQGLGSGTGISSLGDESQFVTEDPTHPFRVKFAFDEKIQSGQRVTLRLCEDMVVDGVLIPANTHLFATCQINDRLSLKVTSLNINGKIFSVSLMAYDNDGGEGIYFPQTQQTGKQAMEEAGQIASSAIQAGVTGYASRLVSSGASLIRSKNGTEKVEVTAGYQFFLMQTN